jgi:hypothetical protein
MEQEYNSRLSVQEASLKVYQESVTEITLVPKDADTH